MKKNNTILIAIIAFILGVFSFYLYNLKTNQVQMKITANMQNNTQTSQSGRYENLQFESLRRVKDTFYIKFSQQIEHIPFSNDCALDGSDDEIKEGCSLMPIRRAKLNPEIDITKEYQFTTYGTVALITYDDSHISGVELLPIDFFYNFLNKLEKPKITYYSVFDNPEQLKFNVIMLDNKIVNIAQVYES